MTPILLKGLSHSRLVFGLMTLLSTCTVADAQSRAATLADLKTRAERTNFTETSRYDDVIAFLNTVDQASDLVHVTSHGYSFEGRPLPLAVVGRVSDARPDIVRASGRLRVYLQANIHAGEVEGKEAVQALVRDVARGAHREWLDTMVLLVNPVYNADGTERVSLTSRGLQHGPIGGQGTRANAQNLNINRDDIKLDTPEARSMVKMLNEYDPHVMVDLHTTNGSRHAYHLTYETPNNPAVDPRIITLAREWMGHVTKAIKAKDGWDFHGYGNVSGQAPQRVWTTVEDLPRYTHNYWGMRNRFGILSETYSYLPFADRVTTNARFLEELLGFAHANAARLRDAAAAADKQSIIGQQVSLRSRLKRSPEMVEILMGEVEEEVNPYSGRVMHKRLDVRKPERMWEEASFEAIETERVPTAYFVLPEQKLVIERLRAHGIVLEPVAAPLTTPVEEFQIASTEVASQPFENHQERTATGKYVDAERTIPAGAFRVPMNQPLARLAFYLLEPRSNDGLVTWNVLDDAIKQSQYPILRTRN
jgi:Zinc carboxypeptidase